MDEKDQHVIEAMGKSKIVIKKGKITEVGEPEIEYCPLFEKYRGIKKLTKQSIRENIEFRMDDFGMCTSQRTLKMKDFLSFGIFCGAPVRPDTISICKRQLKGKRRPGPGLDAPGNPDKIVWAMRLARCTPNRPCGADGFCRIRWQRPFYYHPDENKDRRQTDHGKNTAHLRRGHPRGQCPLLAQPLGRPKMGGDLSGGHTAG